MFSGFSVMSLFQEESHPLAPLTWRGLQMQNPKKVQKYLETLEIQLDYQKLLQKIDKLYDSALNGEWSDNKIQEYERLDQLIT